MTDRVMLFLYQETPQELRGGGHFSLHYKKPCAVWDHSMFPLPDYLCFGRAVPMMAPRTA